MQDKFQIISQKVDGKEQKLILQAQGTLAHSVVNGRLRILCVFSYGSFERRFPVEAECEVSKEETAFSFMHTISLGDVFYQFEVGQEEDVEITFEYCDSVGKWHSFSEKVQLPASLFTKERKKKTFWRQWGKRLGYVLCTILLPIWLFDGFMVAKGYKKSKYLPEEMRGKRAIFYHAHGLVKNLTGYGYSMRELKTNYFCRKYDCACKKTVPQGILFLSEREVELGGNLDRVRREIASKTQKWAEFLDSRPIHKLPFGRIREAAKMVAGAKVVVLEDFYPQLHALELRGETKVVQLWHACGAFKMFGLSDIGKVKNLGQNTRNHRSYSYAFVSGENMVPFYSEAFGIAEKQVLPLGVPRTDTFFDTEYAKKTRQRLYKRYPDLCDKKVVLFAPTFRGSGNKDAFYPMERFSVQQFMEKLPEEYVLVVKNHPFVKERFCCEEKYKGRFFDMTGEEHINDLLFVTSLLITDYSSSIFEAALLRIPMLFYVFDLEEYIRTRDFYFDFAGLVPGEQVRDQEALLQKVQELSDGSGNEERLQAFCDYFLGALEGNSTKKISNFLLDLEKMEN